MTTDNIMETVSQVSDRFPASGRININANGDKQSSFNLLIIDNDGIEALKLLGESAKFDAEGSNGEHWVQVHLDNTSKGVMRRKARGANRVLVEGTLIVQDVVNGRPRGRFIVTDASEVTLFNGGRQIERETPDRDDRGTGAGRAAATSLRGMLRN
jgi:hypothetical protein